MAVPSLIRAFLPALQSIYYSTVQIPLKLLVLSGEVFDISLWKMLVKLLPQTSILNIYGSTEVNFRLFTFGLIKSLQVLILNHLEGKKLHVPLCFSF